MHVRNDMISLELHRALANALVERYQEGSRLSTLLFVKEFSRPDIRNEYLSRGIGIFCSGHRNDPQFLLRTRETLLSADLLVMNTVGSVTWYAGYLSKPVLFLEGYCDPPSDDWWYASEECLRRRWPGLFIPNQVDWMLEESRRQLGHEALREPEDLRQMLGWKHATTRMIAKGLKCYYDIRSPMPNNGSREDLPSELGPLHLEP